MSIIAISFAITALLAEPGAEPPVEALTERLDEARYQYDEGSVRQVIIELKAYLNENPSSTEARFQLARAALSVAELYRLRYEEDEDLGYFDKRQLGQQIDDAAGTGLDALEYLPTSSEKYRMMADLWGTMIRSDYRGKRYGDRMEKAGEVALELDPDNPDAYVTNCKRALYAPEQRGGDVEKAIQFLNKALQLAPEHEAALILRGVAYEKLGKVEQARADWEKALEINPNCLPAKERLEELEEASG